ncbi:MAG: hypothetical protein HQK63_00065 [Desulfamplus sp.]|nr:hypothetical protein [Desulfamplus sp.]
MLTAFIKKLLNFLYRFIATKIIVVIITNCAVLFIVELSELIKEMLKNINNKIMTPINNLENWLFTLVHDVYTALENILNSIRTKIEAALNNLMPNEIQTILNLINFAAWLDLLITSTIANIKSSMQTLLTTVLTPILTIASTINNTINTIEQEIAIIEQKINRTTQDLYDSVKTQLTTIQNDWNAQINLFLNSIEQGFNWYNEGVNAIETAASVQRQTITTHNADVQNIINQIVLTDDLDSVVNLLAQIQPISTTPLDINYNQYKILIATPPTPLTISFTMPTIDTITGQLKAELFTLQNDINNLETELNQLPTNISNQFLTSFPAILTSNLTTQLKTIMIAAITQIIIIKRDQIIDFIKEIRTNIDTIRQAKQTEIQNKSVEVVQEINQEINDFVLTIPNLIKPSLERYLDKIMEEVEKARNQITDNVQITDFIPDINAIQSIMNTLQTNKHKPNTTPNITNRKRHRQHQKLTIQDIHRLLCDNFYRTERLALIFTLAPHDIRINTSDITQLLLDLQP